MVHGYIDVYIWKAAVEKAQSFDPAKVRAAAVTLDAIPTPLGAVKFAANNSLVQTGYIGRSEEHTSELQSLMRISYAVFCLKTKTIETNKTNATRQPHIQ